MKIKLVLFDECEFCTEFKCYAIHEINPGAINSVELGCRRYITCKNAKKAQERLKEEREKEGEE